MIYEAPMATAFRTLCSINAGHRIPSANPRIMFHGCGGDALSTGYGALHHEWVEVGPSRLQGSGEARRARIEDTHRALVGLRVVAIITDSTMGRCRSR